MPECLGLQLLNLRRVGLCRPRSLLSGVKLLAELFHAGLCDLKLLLEPRLVLQSLFGCSFPLASSRQHLILELGRTLGQR